MDKILRQVEKVLNLIVSALIGLMMVWVFVQVITRYMFGFTPSFGEELARYMFVWIVFLCLPVVAKKGGHMAIEMLTARLRGIPLKVCRIIADSFTIAFLLLMVYEGALMVNRASFQTSPALEISMSWVYIVIPVGCFIMLLNVLVDFFALLRTPGAAMKKGG
ncbi:TRAP transporter small permease [Desulfovibrio sp. OttesenSCG-928-F20]|nr:TRAP transporter small permease [Desulfovibrio sp. OttesenSCG-928-F20]